MGDAAAEQALRRARAVEVEEAVVSRDPREGCDVGVGDGAAPGGPTATQFQVFEIKQVQGEPEYRAAYLRARALAGPESEMTMASSTPRTRSRPASCWLKRCAKSATARIAATVTTASALSSTKSP